MRPILCALLLIFTLPAHAAERLAALDGGTASWSDHLGRGDWVLVKVWASDCEICNRTISELVGFVGEQRHASLKVIGVAIDGYSNRKGVDAFIDRHRVNFPTLIDDGYAVADLYLKGTGMDWGGFTPTYLLFSPGGQLVAQRVGPLKTSSVTAFITRFED